MDGKESVGTCWVPRYGVLSLSFWQSGLKRRSLVGTSQVTLDVLSGVASDFLLNVGRTIRFLSDKYGATMTPEVRIPHPHIRLFLKIFPGDYSSYFV